ncbi:MAG: hypothetical protein K2N43_03480 [Lachnospiraceae bacterium]|nr:hypothetical protein [Lachnospiraceae bacterium]
MATLNPKVKDALVKIDFITRYENLSSHFSADRTPEEDCLVYIDGEEVMEMIKDLGYSPQFDAKEKFYKIEEEHIGEFVFGVHIILWEGMVELIWVVKENGTLLLGAPWGTYSKRLINTNYRIKPPVFGTYEDLEDILKITFRMYEDFKNAFMQP